MKKIVLVAAFLAMPLFAQTAAPWTPPRTIDGQPDLQGVWDTATMTPLERPADLADKPFFTPQEAAAYEKALLYANNRDRRDGDGQTDMNRAYNQAWFDRGSHIVKTMRTSLIVDPPAGRIPYSSEGRARLAKAAEYTRQHPADSPEDLALTDHCLLWGSAGPPMLPGPYNNTYQIFQTADSVVIVIEMIHDVRIIPIVKRPHLPAGIRPWLGDSRGHWEGNTLVVETTNFSSKSQFRGSTENLRVVERITRTSADTITYDFTVEDPATFSRPWSGSVPMNKTKGPVYEYACHEGNYGLVGVLQAARVSEKKAEKKAEK